MIHSNISSTIPKGKWLIIRRIVQYVSLTGFLTLFALTTPRFSSALPVNLFFRVDPLVALITGLASRTVILPLALLTLLITLLVGRVWCGWVCPVGTLLDIFPSPRKGRKPPPWWRKAKYVLLGALLFSAVAKVSLLGSLDPITILMRFLDVLVLKVRPVLPVNGLVMALPLLAILTLNLFAPRFWCRYLCPLGALLGLISKAAAFHRRVGENCTECGLCVELCPMEAISPENPLTSDPAECIVCLNCYERCPRQAISIERISGIRSPHLPERRMFLASVIAGATALLLAKALPSPRQLRPPGATEESLLSRCVRCGECLKVCPTGALQPDLSGLERLWTPVFVPRIGYCSYNCNACGAVCPTGAIPALSLEEKRATVIGKAIVDASRCLAWAHLQPCEVCVKTCPLPRKAIELVKVEAVNKLGEVVTVKCPQVIEELCVGCGICEFNCPVPGPGAIKVRPL
ncbi:MAG TPA: 4Fe-4S binding protein [Chloroflexi bacterium]|nr:4Fe-4S binding protein [Chloroflexota bacterium]